MKHQSRWHATKMTRIWTASCGIWKGRVTLWLCSSRRRRAKRKAPIMVSIFLCVCIISLKVLSVPYFYDRVWDVAHLVRTSDGHTTDASSIPQCSQAFFSQSHLSVQTLTCVHILPCAITCINICAHVKDPVVHFRVWWIMETLKQPACAVGWVVRLCHSWLSPGKATRISHGRNPVWTIQL